MTKNQIANAAPLFGLPKLASLYLEGNKLTDIKGIGALKWLGMLSLKGNQIVDLSPLEPLAELRFLFIDNNQITDLAPLHRMLKKDLEGNRSFAPYISLFMGGNPYTKESKKLLEELKALKLRMIE